MEEEEEKEGSKIMICLIQKLFWTKQSIWGLTFYFSKDLFLTFRHGMCKAGLELLLKRRKLVGDILSNILLINLMLEIK